jgi:hypothetical protein
MGPALAALKAVSGIEPAKDRQSNQQPGYASR